MWPCNEIFLSWSFLVVFIICVFCNRDLPASERARWKIYDNLVRFSFGIEDFEDLKADIIQALEVI